MSPKWFQNLPKNNTNEFSAGLRSFLNNNNNDALKRSKSNTSSSQSKSPGLSSGDPIKSGDLAHLWFPFDGQIGKDELKESLREAFREMSDVKVKPMNDDNAKKKKTKRLTAGRREGTTTTPTVEGRMKRRWKT